MNNTMNEMITVNIDYVNSYWRSLEDYSKIHIPVDKQNEFIEIYLKNRTKPLWKRLTRSAYLYSFFYLTPNQAADIADDIDNLLSQDIPDKKGIMRRMLKFDDITEASMVSIMIFEYISELRVVTGHRKHSLFKRLSKQLMALISDPDIAELEVIDNIENFADCYIQRYSSVEVYSSALQAVELAIE